MSPLSLLVMSLQALSLSFMPLILLSFQIVVKLNQLPLESKVGKNDHSLRFSMFKSFLKVHSTLIHQISYNYCRGSGNTGEAMDKDVASISNCFLNEVDACWDERKEVLRWHI